MVARGAALPRRLAALALALVLAAVAGPTPAAASIPKSALLRVEQLYADASHAAEAGDHQKAAECYREVLKVLPEEEETHASRTLALVDAIAAYRAGYASAGDGALLCDALALLDTYDASLRSTYGAEASAQDGAQTAIDARAQLDAEVASAELSCETDDLDPEPEPAEAPAPDPDPEPAPAPTRAGPDPLLIAGGASAGIGGLLLVTMGAGLVVGAGAERDGDALRRERPELAIDDPTLASITRRGQTGNRLAIASGVIAGAALITGAVLIGVSLRRRGSARRERPQALGIDGGGLFLRF